jgi:hypothetical protein
MKQLPETKIRELNSARAPQEYLMSLTKIITLGLAHLLLISACQAGSSERRKSLLTENRLEETATVTEPETGGVVDSGTSTETPTEEKAEESGTGVNNGIFGPMGEILSCLGEDDEAQEVSFSIRHTAAVTQKRGVLTIGGKTIVLSCDEVESDPNAKPIPDKSQALWTCSETREGEGLYHVNVQLHGFTGMTLGTVSIDQTSPLKPAHVSTMGCRK